MRVDMDLSFIIPIKIESLDRLRNCITILSYLRNVVPDADIYIKEVDEKSKFTQYVLPEVQKNADTSKIHHTFQENPDDALFHRTRYINDLFLQTKSKVVWHYDVDVLFPRDTYLATYNMIANNGFDFVYPFGCGPYQNAINYDDVMYERFINSGYNLEVLKTDYFRLPATVGFSQVFNAESYAKFGFMNENFVSWGCEDCELYYRMNILGYKVGRVMHDVYHLEHSRTFNSHYHNPKFHENNQLWQWFRKQNVDVVRKYYEDQKYVKERRTQWT